MRKRFWKGLRAIELVIIISVISIVLGVVVVRYPDFKCRSMQSEAKFSLQEVYFAQKYYHGEHDHYATFEQLYREDARVRPAEKYYQLSDRIPPMKDRFSITALGKAGTLVEGEIWTVNEWEDIRLEKAVCKNHE